MFIVYDCVGGGWVKNDILEGWIFTRVASSATTFETEAEARKIIYGCYPNHKSLEVQPVDSGPQVTEFIEE